MPAEFLSDMAMPRVLYVDDDVALCGTVARALVQHGFTVTSATNAGMAMSLLKAQRFDLVVLDHYMPEQDGLETLAQISLDVTDPPPVVYLIRPDEGAIAIAALKAGAADYLIKTGAGEFLDLLHQAVRQTLEQMYLRREKEAAHRVVEDTNLRLVALVERQAVLLREMNHRIANSLALVGALIRLQLSSVTDESARNALTDTQHRLAAIMQVHRSLYMSADVENTDLSAYLRGLLAELERSLMATASRHRLMLQTIPVVVATDRVVPVGVIVTELVTNAVKYAYPTGTTAGEIRIRLRRDGVENALLLTVEDDGVGFSTSSAMKGSGLGHKVIDAMAVSLQARVTIDAGHRGARVTIAFPP